MIKKIIKKALVSVSDKSQLKVLADFLYRNKIEVLSTGGTAKELKMLNPKIKLTEISNYTGSKEILDGRVKTLHPKIHAGILADRNNKEHMIELKMNSADPIDLVVVNLYPFEKISSNTKNNEQICIENIDIGGPTMVRAAAKNFKNVTIITSKNDYMYLIREIEKNEGATTLKFRELMSSKAFGLTAYYDAMIANWFNKKLDIQFPERKTIFGKKLQQLRYGENPHQKSSIYVSDYNDQTLGFDQLHGKELSYNNYNDMFASLEILRSLKKFGTVVIKHANPCGVSENKNPLTSFVNAFATDPTSAFGGVIACNFKVTKKIATEINKNFLEVILAKGFDKESLTLLKKKKNLRIIDITAFKLKNLTSIKNFDGSFLIQSKDKLIFDKKKLKFVTKLKPNKKELAEIEFAFNICKYVKSNAIILCNNFSTIGIGAGQPSRLDSCKIATQKAKRFQSSKIKNSVAASDAFFPFADGLTTLIKAGVKTIVQPGGSIRDQEVINAADKAKIKMVFTGIRHFNH